MGRDAEKKSILQDDEKHCYLTGRAGTLHKHHIYPGYSRQKSEDHGFFVFLTPELHNMSSEGVHFNHELDLRLRRECQRKYEEAHSREEFMKIIGRSYL